MGTMIPMTCCYVCAVAYSYNTVQSQFLHMIHSVLPKTFEAVWKQVTLKAFYKIIGNINKTKA